MAIYHNLTTVRLYSSGLYARNKNMQKTFIFLDINISRSFLRVVEYDHSEMFITSKKF